MNTLKVVLVLFLGLVVAQPLKAQPKVVNEIAVALRNGDASALGSHLAPNVSLGLEDKEQSYSKPQATQVLKSFFNRHAAVDFTYKHSARSQQKDQFFVGRLQTKNGDFRVTYFLIKTPNGPRIKRLRLEPK